MLRLIILCSIASYIETTRYYGYPPFNLNPAYAQYNRPGRCKAIDGDWTDWTDWTLCDVTDCTKGSQERTRNCTNPEPRNGGSECEGAAVEYKNCGEPCISEEIFETIPISYENGIPVVNQTSNRLLIIKTSSVLLFMDSNQIMLIDVYTDRSSSLDGKMWYYQSNDEILISPLSADIQRCFATDFSGVWMFSVLFNITQISSQLTDTIEFTVVTDGSSTYIRNRYIETNNNININVEMLTNRGDGLTDLYYRHPNYQQPEISNLDSETNCDEEGIFWYRIDDTVIGEPIVE